MKVKVKVKIVERSERLRAGADNLDVSLKVELRSCADAWAFLK